MLFFIFIYIIKTKSVNNKRCKQQNILIWYFILNKYVTYGFFPNKINILLRVFIKDVHILNSPIALKFLIYIIINIS